MSVSGSTSETQGLTNIEAAANGLPLLYRQASCFTGVINQGDISHAAQGNGLALVKRVVDIL